MPAFTTYEWLTLTVTAAVAAGTILWTWLLRGRSRDATTIPKPFQPVQEPVMEDSAGTPSLQQLTQGMKLNPKATQLAETLYDLGLEQYNHPVNNRDRIVHESRKIMAELASILDLDQLKLADGIGRTAASAEHERDESQQETINLMLSPNAKMYAQHKRRECEALASIAKDLEKNVPRTDYMFLKQRIASGETGLDSIVDQLPIIWQSIRTLNEKVETPNLKRKPPRPEKVIAEYNMPDGRILRDKRAEIDGDWLTSHKYNFLTPCPPPTQKLRRTRMGNIPRTGEQIRDVRRAPSSEWLTEFWRQAGYMDQVYLRASTGTLPYQLRRAYRRRQIRKVQWSVLAAGIIANIAIFIIKHS